jgi:hypothetical protein
MIKIVLKKSKVFAAITLSILTLNSVAHAQLKEAPARLSPTDSLNITVNGQSKSIVLQAENQSRPLLNVNLKRSIRLVDTEIEIKEFLAQGITLAQIQAAFKLRGFAQIKSFADLIVIKNYAHGVKGFTKAEIFKKDVTEASNAHFWYAVLPKGAKVTRAIVQRDWFSEGAGAHGQVRYILNSPVLLVPQEVKPKSIQIVDATRVDWKSHFTIENNIPHLAPADMVYSLYAIRYQNGPANWDLFTGLGGVFANAYTLASTAHNVVYLAKDDLVEQHDLISPQTLGTKSFLASLKRSDQYKEERIYHLIFNSCITEMNRALYAEGQGYPLRDLGVQSSDFNPYTFIEKLKPVISKTAVPTLNQEFGSAVKSKAINPHVEKNIALVQSAEFETIVLNIALEAMSLSYKELLEISTAFANLQKAAQSGQGPQLSEINSIEKAMQVLASTGAKPSEKQARILMSLASNPNFIQAAQVLIQKGLVNR